MKHGKRLLVGTMLLTLFLVNMAVPASAYVYNGCKWPSGHAEYQIDRYTIPSGWETQIYNARGTWNAAPSPFYFQQGSSNNIISYGSLGDYSTLATTSRLRTGSTITQCTVVFNSNLGPLWSTSGQALHYDVQSVALHEFGHWLSLGHVNDYDAVMFPTLCVSDVKRSLTSDEIAGIRSIYP